MRQTKVASVDLPSWLNYIVSARNFSTVCVPGKALITYLDFIYNFCNHGSASILFSSGCGKREKIICQFLAIYCKLIILHNCNPLLCIFDVIGDE